MDGLESIENSGTFFNGGGIVVVGDCGGLGFVAACIRIFCARLIWILCSIGFYARLDFMLA
jgi:hypothetical protein